jgi:hypothetical protein
MTPRQLFLWRCLVLITASLMGFGVVLALMPSVAEQMFSLLVYASASHVQAFGPEAVAYIRLVTAVLGCVLFGWGVLFMYLALGPVRKGSKDAWSAFAVSLLAWFVPDTTYSLLSGFWQNALLNLGFAMLFAMPLLALRSFVAKTPS